MENNRNEIGKKLEELRRNANLKQDELAQALDVTRQAISQWELGITLPKGDKLIAICKYFNVGSEYFFDKNTDGGQQEIIAEEIAATEGEEPAENSAAEEITPLPAKKRSRLKTVLITCTVIIALLASAIMLFIAWLEDTPEDTGIWVSSSTWNFDIVTILQIVAGVILFAVACCLVVLTVKHFKNRKK